MSTIKSEFARYQRDIAEVFEGSDQDSMRLICEALEYYARDVGLGDHRVKSGITGLKCLIVKRALCRGSISHDMVKSYGVKVMPREQTLYPIDRVAVTFRDITLVGARTCEHSDAPIRVKP